MVAVGLLSAKGSPGCTTTALALSDCWPEAAPGRRILLAECDVAGGDIASGYLAGVIDVSRGVLGLATTRAQNPMSALWDQLLTLDEDAKRLLLLGLADPRQATSVRAAWHRLAEALPELAMQDIDVVLDLGRLHSAQDPEELRQSVDVLVLVTRSSLYAVAAAQRAAEELRSGGYGDRLRCLVIGEGHPYTAKEIADSLRTPLLGSLPLDAGHLLSPGRGHARPKSTFARTCRQLVGDLRAAASAGAVHV